MDYGIDVSNYQAIADADSVRGNGISFAWCKATEGVGYTDPTFANKVAQLRASGVVVGAYHFARGGDPVAQAHYFRSVAESAGTLDVGALMPMLDMESDEVRRNANGFVTVFYDTLGVEPMSVYANLDWFHNVLDPSSWGSRTILGHVAVWNGDPGNPGWTYDHLAVHQHTSAGNVPGIPGNVDRNATVEPYTLQAITIGNVSAPPAASPSAPTPSSDGDTWTVHSGDTLSRIASAWGVTVASVAAANGIVDPNLIYVGQTVHRPGSASAGPSPVAGGTSYTVRPGDTLSGIAAAEGTSVPTLVAINGISNPDRIYVGQTITLPSANAPVDRVYTVRSGDTLSSIAARLGYPGGYQALAAHNGIADPNRIYPGQQIRY
jgi:LysM repeat protein/GH25 family lysozyme M1 (1,4-beta-N-acetylmuramidase)